MFCQRKIALVTRYRERQVRDKKEELKNKKQKEKDWTNLYCLLFPFNYVSFAFVGKNNQTK